MGTDRLTGAWKLVSYEMGIIMYPSDGFMFAQLMKPDRKPFGSGDWFDGTAEEYKQKVSTYIADSGPFHLDEEKQALTHSRVVRIEGDDLYLSTAPPMQSQGKLVNSHLRRRRAGEM